jgi:tRNA nucleotidyltransferase/poly(A) polymerase
MADQIVVVSPERIAAELRKMLSHPSRRLSLEWMFQVGLLRAIFPELHALLVSEDQREIVLRRVELLERKEFESTLAILVASVKESNAEVDPLHSFMGILQDRWRLSNEETSCVEFAIKKYKALIRSAQLKWSELQPILISPHIDTGLAVAASWLQTDGKHDHPLEFCKSQLLLPNDQLNPVPLVDGRTLIDLGIQPGPIYSEIIQAGRTAQLDGVIRTRDEAIKWVKDRIDKP